jgi:hypothetical protein
MVGASGMNQYSPTDRARETVVLLIRDWRGSPRRPQTMIELSTSGCIDLLRNEITYGIPPVSSCI